MGNRIKTSLAESQMGNEENSFPKTSQAEKIRLCDDDERLTVELFSAACAVFEAAKVAAHELGLSDSHLSEMKSGARTIAGHRLVRAARKNKKAAAVLARFFADLADLEVRKRRQIDKRELRQQLVMALERNPAMFRIAVADAADALGIDEDEAVAVWDENTQEINVG